MADAPHDHDDRAAYYYDQLFSIGVCGAIAGVTIMLWWSNLLGKMLHPKFHIWVALGSFSLLGIVLLRAVAVWRSVDETADHEPKHEHGEECGHDHGQSHAHGHAHSHGHSHSHGDGHDHGWAPWRYVILLLPIVLYFLVLSNPAFDREPVELKSQWWTDSTNFNKNVLGAVINFIVIFRSILWEALPFIILGAIIAGLVEELLPQSVVTAILPKNPVLAVAMGGLLGLVFPMCECGIIPIMRRLLRKGLPLSCCIAYLLAGPVINVVVLLSTFAAFSGMENVFEGGKPSYQMGGWWMLGFRAGMAYVVAIVTALIVEAQYRKHGDALLTPLARPSSLPVVEDNNGERRSVWQRISNVTETALHDFIDITVFLILGALLAATTRLFLTSEDIARIGENYTALAILAMMGLAVVLCLCSEADAFVAASFVTLRPSAKLAFLVLGPMMDFKLYAMYTRIFRPRLILTIYAAVAVQVFVYSMAVHWFWEKYAPDLIDPRMVNTAKVSDKDVENAGTRAGLGLGLVGLTPAGGSMLADVPTACALMLLATDYEAPEMRFTQLESAATSPEQRQFYEGKRVSVVGRYTGSEVSFRLTRYRINCCAADAQPINVVFGLAPGSKETLPAAQLEGKWVRVIGQMRFFESKPGNFHTALLLTPTEREPLSKLVELVDPPANPYVD